MKKQGLYAVLAAISIQLTLGIAYIWSVFQTGIAESIFGGNHAAAGLSFSFMLAMLSVGGIIGGKLAVKYSTQFVVLMGGIIIGTGFLFASQVSANYSWLLWLTYGIMGGTGMGFTYSTTIACAQKWYPHKKGLVTGIIVSALGFGGVIFTPIIESLIKNFGGTGIGESKTFMIMSTVFFTVCTIGSFFMKNPPDNYMAQTAAAAKTAVKKVKDYSPAEILKMPQFYLVTATFLLGCMGGLMVIGFAKPIAVAKGLGATATIGVLAISMFNSLGRLTWGIVSDKLGQIKTIIIILSGTAVLSLLVNSINGYLVYALIALIGFFYGGLLSNFPTLTANLFGPKNAATNYGLVLIGFGGGAIISSQIAGYYKNIAADNINLMFPAFVIASGCAVAGIVMMMVLNTINKNNAEIIMQNAEIRNNAEMAVQK
ncbi:MAG: OFA family MFS transporter [Chitinispirillales bacterium]|jgi:OFA family oxalate/formate antiporter-like MFS transporter|nr:OFA family MFS transporter [Chitinispirillales bacterium]